MSFLVWKIPICLFRRIDVSVFSVLEDSDLTVPRYLFRRIDVSVFSVLEDSDLFVPVGN